MASKKTTLQGSKMDSASAPSTAATNPVVEVDVCYRIVWEKGPGGFNGWSYGPPSSEFEAFVNIEGKSTDGSNLINCVATLHWRNADEIEFFCVYDSKTEKFSGFEWTNKHIFGEDAGDSNGYIEDVSISMKGKSYKDAEEAAEREVLDDSKNHFPFVVIAFVAENEKGMSYGKKVVDGAFNKCALSGKEKKRLRLE